MTAFLIYISVATITVDCYKFIIKHLVYKLILAKNCQRHNSHSFKPNLVLSLIRRCEIVYENEQIQINLSLRKPLYFDTTHFNYDMFDDIILIRLNYNMILLIFMISLIISISYLLTCSSFYFMRDQAITVYTQVSELYIFLVMKNMKDKGGGNLINDMYYVYL